MSDDFHKAENKKGIIKETSSNIVKLQERSKFHDNTLLK